MYYYQISQQLIKSEFEIPYLQTLSSTPQKVHLSIEIKNFSLPDVSSYYSWHEDETTTRVNFYYLNNDYYLEYPNLLNFKISASKITCSIQISEEYHLLHLLTDQVIPLYLSLSYLVLHASAFSFKDTNFILLGKSGAGKSTLISQLYPLGKFIADDYVVIDNQQVPPRILPSYPGIRLLNDNDNKTIQKVPLEYFSSSNTKDHNVIVCLDRDFSLPPKHYNISTPAMEDVYQQLLSELIQLNLNQPTEQLKIFAKLNEFIKQRKILRLSYNDLLEIDFTKLANTLLSSVKLSKQL